MPKITAVCTPGRGGRRYSVGRTPEASGIIQFEEFEKPGQGAMVPWIRVHYEDGSTRELNVAILEYVDREPPSNLPGP